MSKTVVNIHEAKTHLSRLIERARHGDEVTIARAGDPQVKLVPVEGDEKREIELGVFKGKIWIAPDFDETPPEFEPYI